MADSIMNDVGGYSPELGNKQVYDNAIKMGQGLEKKLYGSLGEQVAPMAQDYMGKLQQNLGKDVASADVMRQKLYSTISTGNTKAGLKSVDTTAAKAQEERNAQLQTAATNEAAKRQSLSQYGQAIGATQNAVANLYLGSMGLGVAGQQTPVPEQEPGILSKPFQWLGL